jgi:hypothetical protein
MPRQKIRGVVCGTTVCSECLFVSLCEVRSDSTFPDGTRKVVRKQVVRKVLFPKSTAKRNRNAMERDETLLPTLNFRYKSR